MIFLQKLCRPGGNGMIREKSATYNILPQARLSFRIEGEIKNFSDKQKLKELINMKSTLKYVKGLL